MKKKTKTIALTLTLLLLASTTGYLSYNQKNLQQEYNTKIDLLTQDLQDTKEQTLTELDNKQNQINSINQKQETTKRQIEEIISESEKLGIKIEDISTTTEQKITELDQQLSDLAVESESFTKIIPEVIDSVVSIVTDKGQGSGAIITAEGLLLTNYHVIEGANQISVVLYNGKRYDADNIGYNIGKDLAVLEIESNQNFQNFNIGDSDNLKTGQKIVALGNPAGLSFTATEGIISTPSRTANDGLDYIQTDVTLNPGNSGGPLINAQGEIIGIANFKVSGYEGLGFAIPINRAMEFFNEIINDQ